MLQLRVCENSAVISFMAVRLVAPSFNYAPLTSIAVKALLPLLQQCACVRVCVCVCVCACVHTSSSMLAVDHGTFLLMILMTLGM